jgi:hypothetical protein
VDTASSQRPQKRVTAPREKQQSSAVPDAPVRLTQRRSSSYRSGQQPARAVSAPTQKQYRPPSGSKQQRQSMNSNGYSPSGKVARQKSTHKGSSQRYSSQRTSSSGGKHTGDRRSQRR